MLNKNSSGFAVWYYISALYFFANGYLFYLFFVVKSNAFQYCSNVKWCHLIWATVYKSRDSTL